VRPRNKTECRGSALIELAEGDKVDTLHVGANLRDINRGSGRLRARDARVLLDIISNSNNIGKTRLKTTKTEVTIIVGGGFLLVRMLRSPKKPMVTKKKGD